MSDYKTIERELLGIGQAEMQNIVFQILDKQYTPTNIVNLGSASGVQTTRYGTPDVFLQLSNGNFNDLAENHYFNKSLDRQNEPEIINRNRIMHGLFSREISQKDCLQLFCVISNMVVIKSIIDANEMMDKTIEEMKQLQQKTN